MKVHLESMYGFYHGQDPRTFRPDEECCSEKELDGHKQAVEAAHAGTWTRDDSGCHLAGNAIICKSSFGLGVYSYVADSDNEYVRGATYEDTQRDTYEWEEENDTASK